MITVKRFSLGFQLLLMKCLLWCQCAKWSKFPCKNITIFEIALAKLLLDTNASQSVYTFISAQDYIYEDELYPGTLNLSDLKPHFR